MTQKEKHKPPELIVFSIEGKLIGEYENTKAIAAQFHSAEDEAEKAMNDDEVYLGKYYIFHFGGK